MHVRSRTHSRTPVAGVRTYFKRGGGWNSLKLCAVAARRKRLMSYSSQLHSPRKRCGDRVPVLQEETPSSTWRASAPAAKPVWDRGPARREEGRLQLRQSWSSTQPIPGVGLDGQPQAENCHAFSVSKPECKPAELCAADSLAIPAATRVRVGSPFSEQRPKLCLERLYSRPETPSRPYGIVPWGSEMFG